MTELRRVITMTESEIAYEEIVALYEETFGERIRASVEWVVPLFHACTTGVACNLNGAKCDKRKEALARTVDVLATIFHGREQAELLRKSTSAAKQRALRSARVPRAS